MAVLSADSLLDMTHKFMLYKYLDSIWPEAPNGPVEGNFWSEIVYDYSATYSPNPDNPPFYVDLPMAWPSGELIQEVWDRWLSFDPVVNVHDRLDNLRKLSGILLDAGLNDDYNLHWGHRLLSHYLDRGRDRARAQGEPRQPRRPSERAVPDGAGMALAGPRRRRRLTNGATSGDTLAQEDGGSPSRGGP